MHTRLLSRCSSLLATLFFFGPAASAVTIDWVTVGSPGNACDLQLQGCFGTVADTYLISKYETTNAQYAEFLNAVADADTYELYATSMDGSIRGGITRSGVSGSYTYSTKAGFENKPVNFVSYWDALRFANWLHNGQPVGAQGAGTTETGAYTLTEQGISDNSIARNPGATIFLTSEDEWYKAAYYDALSASYFDYPVRSDTATVCATPSATPNTANCGSEVGNVTDVGAYTDSSSPFGTFDQGGNVGEWNESILIGLSSQRGERGGSWGSPPLDLAALNQGADVPAFGDDNLGFRVAAIPAAIPEPATAALVIAGLLALARTRRVALRPRTVARFHT